LARWFQLSGVIAVDPEVRDGVLTGRMRHPNVRGEQKAVRLRQWLGAPAEGPLEGVELWAYGNTSGDHALLALADRAFWLGKPDRCPPGAVQFRPDVAF
jgi:phosphoserine phosphatase